ncbi:MAG: hypothetical protein B9S34_08395 [Opitutia bacterium Tous-C1TDCM]|nr:MAG: hypothetical protein B9S34_08395 [Opitutae bacterium Tous-C1TDCM]
MFARALLVLAFALPLSAQAEETPKPGAREALRARLAEDAKKVPARRPAPVAATPAPLPLPATPTAATPAKPAEPAAPVPVAPKTAAKNPDAKEIATVLPKMEVKKGRITVLDQQLALQEQDLAREKKNLQVSETDLALNDSKLAKPLAIFGGDSAQYRRNVASERVELMEAEKDLIEAIAHAKTKEEKAMLQKQLDELRTLRRNLDKSMR